MKKMTLVVAVLATLAGSAAHAQTTKSGNKTMGNGAQAGKMCNYDNFAWGIGLGALVVLGLVVGFTVAGAVGDPSTSH